MSNRVPKTIILKEETWNILEEAAKMHRRTPGFLADCLLAKYVTAVPLEDVEAAERRPSTIDEILKRFGDEG